MRLGPATAAAVAVAAAASLVVVGCFDPHPRDNPYDSANAALDLDGDGLPNAQDPCPDLHSDEDRDGDCVSNRQDPCPDLHADTPDRDADCVSDGDDACPDLHSDEDRDGDCVPDDEDACPDLHATEKDRDGDCVSDDADACPDLHAGEDRDGDCVSDAEDACPDNAAVPAQADRDGDCVSDAEDRCPDNAAVPAQADRDADCLADAVDLFPDDPEQGMVRIEAGEFQMGSPEDEANHRDDEVRHRVEITRAFLLGRTEVTQRAWREVMGDAPSNFAACGDECPVERVSWLEVVEFCNALSAREGREECYVVAGDDVTWPLGLDCRGYRLPTEAEWEYAARAGTQTPWSCGGDPGCLDGVAWYRDNSEDTTHPVGEKAANAWGLYDMQGNVWEWVWDRYGENYYADGQVDPTGPAAGALRVFRGGGWSSVATWLRAAARDGNRPAFRRNNLGFRPARSVP